MTSLQQAVWDAHGAFCRAAEGHWDEDHQYIEGTDPAADAALAKHQELLAQEKAAQVDCEFCDYRFEEALGRYGCPNCEGEGLD